MSRFFIPCIFLFCCLLTSACNQSTPYDYRDHRGHSGHFSEFRGKWIVINYWAIWCKPCVEEIPELNQFALSHPEDVVLFGVDFDQSQGASLQQAIDKLGIQFPVLTTDPASQLGYERPTVLPTTLLIDPQGKLHSTLRGPQTQQSLAAIIARPTANP